MKHHTKDKGDIGVGFVIADLLSKGIQVCLPISEHLPFDLIGVYPDGKVKKISVKYRKILRGCLMIPLKSVYSDSKGAHSKPIDKTLIDMIAIYSPDTKKVYYVNHNEFGGSIAIRIEPSKNKQVANVKNGENYLIP